MNMFFQGLSAVFQVEPILLILVGVLIGMIFGAIPGLTGVLGMTLCLPLSFSMDPVPAMLFLLSIFCGGAFGGSITAILIGTPGSAESAATMLDGYPLAKKGKAYKALLMALTASCTGGFISAISLLIFAPIIAKVAMNFGPPEYFVMAVFGLTIIAAISSDSIAKGLFMGCFGIFIALIGMDNLSGVLRFTFNSINLYNGFSFIAVLLGVFAMTKVFITLYNYMYDKDSLNDISKDEITKIEKDDKLELKEIKDCTPTILKGSLIGIIVGAIPAAGTAIASFVSYNQARSSSKNPESFGLGNIRGVAAAESANSAVTGSSLIPMLTVGIPGSGGAATLMGALTIQGLAPGPLLFRDYAFEMYAIMVGLLLINVLLYFEGKALMRFFAKVSLVPNSIITTSLIFLCVAGAFSVQRLPFDIYVMFGAGVLFYFFQRFKFSPMPVILGMLLGPVAEDSLRRSLVISNGSWNIFFIRPICLIFIALTIIVVVSVIRQNYKKTKKAKTV